MDIDAKLKEKEDQNKQILEQVRDISRQIQALNEQRQMLLNHAVENNGAIKVLQELKK